MTLIFCICDLQSHLILKVKWWMSSQSWHIESSIWILAYFTRFCIFWQMTLELWFCDLQGHLNVKWWMSSERSWKVGICISMWIMAYLTYLVNDLGIMHLWPSGSSQGQRVDVIRKVLESWQIHFYMIYRISYIFSE
jgi:hypothetical protein